MVVTRRSSALSKSSWLEKRKIIGIVKNEGSKPKKVKEVIEVVRKSGGIEYSEKKMEGFRDEALMILKEFENVEVRDSLEELVRYTTDRKF